MDKKFVAKELIKVAKLLEADYGDIDVSFNIYDLVKLGDFNSNDEMQHKALKEIINNDILPRIYKRWLGELKDEIKKELKKHPINGVTPL
jgi:hypothetical protein